MKATLPLKVYRSLKKTIDEDERLDSEVADAVAGAMKDWAIAHGATHFTHWFQPLTGITAEKHDSFISPPRTAASSWSSPARSLSRASRTPPPSPPAVCAPPLRRGATAWDPTSYAFIKERRASDGVLLLGGEALDKKHAARAPCRRSTGRQCVFCACSATR